MAFCRRGHRGVGRSCRSVPTRPASSCDALGSGFQSVSSGNVRVNRVCHAPLFTGRCALPPGVRAQRVHRQMHLQLGRWSLLGRHMGGCCGKALDDGRQGDLMKSVEILRCDPELRSDLWSSQLNLGGVAPPIQAAAQCFYDRVSQARWNPALIVELKQVHTRERSGHVQLLRCAPAERKTCAS
jgi:hypothetical protein